MRALLMFAVLAVAVPDRENPTPKEETKPLQVQLLGEWRIVKAVMNGQDDPKGMKNTVLTFAKDEIRVRENGQERPQENARYRIDNTKKPIGIDIMPKGGPEMKIEGILKLEGEQLIICFPDGGPGGPRPQVFVSTPQSGVVVLYFVRVKK